jgi:hypothetical protein
VKSIPHLILLRPGQNQQYKDILTELQTIPTETPRQYPILEEVLEIDVDIANGN